MGGITFLMFSWAEINQHDFETPWYVWAIIGGTLSSLFRLQLGWPEGTMEWLKPLLTDDGVISLFAKINALVWGFLVIWLASFLTSKSNWG